MVLFRNEPLLAIDLFHKPMVRNDLEALAQTIQNLILINPGTLPNDPLFGVGIERYLFELMNDNTISEIKTNIEEQISKYIVHDDVTVNVEVKPVGSSKNNINALGVSVQLYPSNSNGIESDSDNSLEIGFAYAASATTRQTISKIMI